MKITVRYFAEIKRKNQIQKAISIINSAQNYFFYEAEIDEKIDVCEDASINWHKFKELQKKFIEDNKYIIYITEKPFDDNWFSHEEAQYSVITTHDWEEHFAPPSLKTFLVYQIAQASINFEGDINETMEIRMVHDDPEGCMFDFCITKPDIKFGMIAGNICPRCRAELVRYGITEKAINAVEKMLWHVRAEAIGKPIIFDEHAAFVVMRFTANDENSNAYEYGIKTALETLGIRCSRADSKITSGSLLNKIERSIEKSRFIIVKVDENNLNVYFELGLAMGLHKDILLISENDWVLNLPTDLRNLECLTYTKGNYHMLEQKIIEYYQNNYHYNQIGKGNAGKTIASSV